MNTESNIENQENNIPYSWYSLRVISGKEKVVEENILYESKMNNIQEFIEEVFVPFEKVVELRNNKKVVKEKMFFPGYILIKMVLNKKSKYIIENIYLANFITFIFVSGLTKNMSIQNHDGICTYY